MRTMNNRGCRRSFSDAIFAAGTDGSGIAASYVRVLDVLGLILMGIICNQLVGVLCVMWIPYGILASLTNAKIKFGAMDIRR